jgi:hypothetical protein
VEHPRVDEHDPPYLGTESIGHDLDHWVAAAVADEREVGESLLVELADQVVGHVMEGDAGAVHVSFFEARSVGCDHVVAGRAQVVGDRVPGPAALPAAVYRTIFIRSLLQRNGSRIPVGRVRSCPTSTGSTAVPR